AAHPTEEERRRGLREPERCGRGELAATRHHPRILSDQDPPPESRGRERPRPPALRGHWSQPPADSDPGDGAPEAAVLRTVPPGTAAHQPGAGACCAERRAY